MEKKYILHKSLEGAMPQPNHLVTKSNALIEASYRLTIYEQRILLACISQVKRDEVITDQVMYSVSVQDIARLANITTGAAYQKLDEAAVRLKRREVRIAEEPNGKGRKPKVMVTGWVQTVVYIPEEGRVELRFNHDVIPYINLLSSEFTRYALGDVAAMTSAHGIRLYELLMQWEGRGRREVSLTWLRKTLYLGDQYPVYADFRRWVIEPAVKQINEHSSLKARWEPIKTGRKITHLRFTFAPKAPTRRVSPPGKGVGQGTKRLLGTGSSSRSTPGLASPMRPPPDASSSRGTDP